MHKTSKTVRVALAALLVALLSGMPQAKALDTLTIGLGGKGDWDANAFDYGNKAEIFQKHGIDLKVTWTEGSGPTLQALIAGSLDMGLVAVPGALAASMKGAPVKMFTAYGSGVNWILFYTLSDSPVKSFKDIKPDTTIAYSSAGSSSQFVLQAMLKKYGVTGKPTMTGGQSATLVQVMSKQIDVGWDATDGLGSEDFRTGKLRFIGSGADLPEYSDLTLNTLAASTDTLTKRRPVMIRFMQALEETVNWMYEKPTALEWWAEEHKVSVDEARRVRNDIYPRSEMRLGDIHKIDMTIDMALSAKRIPEQPTPEQVKNSMDIVWQPPK